MIWYMEVLKLLLPFCAAGIGAFAGGQIAFARYKSERAHDRLIDWYERANRALVLALQATGATIQELKETGQLDAELQVGRDAVLDELDIVLDSGLMYARPTTLARLREAQIRAKACMQEIEEAGPDCSVEHVITSLRTMRRVVREAHLHLVADGRNELLGKANRLELRQLIHLKSGAATAAGNPPEKPVTARQG